MLRLRDLRDSPHALLGAKPAVGSPARAGQSPRPPPRKEQAPPTCAFISFLCFGDTCGTTRKCFVESSETERVCEKIYPLFG